MNAGGAGLMAFAGLMRNPFPDADSAVCKTSLFEFTLNRLLAGICAAGGAATVHKGNVLVSFFRRARLWFFQTMIRLRM